MGDGSPPAPRSGNPDWPLLDPGALGEEIIDYVPGLGAALVVTATRVVLVRQDAHRRPRSGVTSWPHAILLDVNLEPPSHGSGRVILRTGPYAWQVISLFIGAREWPAAERVVGQIRTRAAQARRSRRDASWQETVRSSLEIRRSVSGLLQRMPRQGTPAQVAARAIAELGKLIGVESIALLQPRAGRYGSYAAHGELAEIYPPGSSLDSGSSSRLLARAAEGYWVQPLPGRRGHTAAYFPVEVTGDEPGLLVVADRAEGPMAQRILSRLSDLSELAEVMGGFVSSIAAQGAAEVMPRRQIERIIEDRAFKPFFQPIVRLDDRRIVGFEALTRFANGVSPDVHFKDAERAALGPELELATLAAAIEAGQNLPRAAKLYVNLSPARLLDTDRLAPLIARWPRSLVIELMEYEAIADYAQLRTAIASLGDNVEISVDDAGFGYASLRHIQALRPQSMKLDLEWVHAIEVDPAIRPLVAGLVQFGRQMECQIIGEGVETDGQHAALMALGVDFGQGDRFGKPAPAQHWQAD